VAIEFVALLSPRSTVTGYETQVTADSPARADFAASEDYISRSKDICALAFFTGELYISLLVHYLFAQRAEFPHLALPTLVELEVNRSARGGATVVGQGHYQLGVTWLGDAVIRE